VKKGQSSVGLPWGVIAGIAVLVGWSLFSWRTAAHSPVSEASIHVPKPETLGIVLPPEPAKGAVVSPNVLEDQKKPVKIRQLRSRSSERLLQEGLVPPPEEVQRMKKKGVVTY